MFLEMKNYLSELSPETEIIYSEVQYSPTDGGRRSVQEMKAEIATEGQIIEQPATAAGNAKSERNRSVLYNPNGQHYTSKC
jgi:hypothetical protein